MYIDFDKTHYSLTILLIFEMRIHLLKNINNTDVHANSNNWQYAVLENDNSMSNKWLKHIMLVHSHTLRMSCKADAAEHRIRLQLNIISSYLGNNRQLCSKY